MGFMSNRVNFVYSDDFSQYCFNKTHPFNPIRLELTYELMEELNLFNSPNIKVIKSESVDLEDLARVHTDEYIDIVRSVSRDNKSYSGIELLNYNLGTGDNPIFPGMFEAALLLVGSTLTAAKVVYENKSDYSMNIGGGLHHGIKSAASGFCIFNYIAVAIKYLQSQEKDLKILYIDLDVHHGDGVQNIFYDDPNVLCISIHEDGRFQFPGTGFVDERGKDEGFGYTINVPVLPNTPDNIYFEIIESIMPKIFENYHPDYVFTQFGVDTHYTDLLGHLSLTTNVYSKITSFLRELISKYSNNKWIVLGGGGYSIEVVPRAWSLILSGMLGVTLNEDLPETWRERFRKITKNEAPKKLHDPKVYLEDERLRKYSEELIEKLKSHVDFLAD